LTRQEIKKEEDRKRVQREQKRAYRETLSSQKKRQIKEKDRNRKKLKRQKTKLASLAVHHSETICLPVIPVQHNTLNSDESNSIIGSENNPDKQDENESTAVIGKDDVIDHNNSASQSDQIDLDIIPNERQTDPNYNPNSESNSNCKVSSENNSLNKEDENESTDRGKDDEIDQQSTSSTSVSQSDQFDLDIRSKKKYVCLRSPDRPYFSATDPNLFYRQLFDPNFCLISSNVLFIQPLAFC